MKSTRWTRGLAAIATAGTVLAAASPIAFAAPRGLHPGLPAAISRGHHESISVSLVKSNAAIAEALYQQYESLIQNASNSSTQSPAITQLISELQSDLTSLQNATSNQAARQAMNQILKQVAAAEAALQDSHALSALEQQIAKEYSQFSQELNQVTSATNPPAGQLRQLWNLENLLIAKLREAILELGATPTAPAPAQGTSGSTTSSSTGSSSSSSATGSSTATNSTTSTSTSS
ncbi:hypothetical protein IW967_04435 [Alicyclobacillus mali]|uniref:DUF5667 domain-containing protein n=1 Tax=Alicyclobacillus mali (ex Roth et al. 2021) TaxID=1123961 RepID=A0ABS0F1H5_9BACL|nr:hypothetical protein [Alicyclobacillus mali (ex Roth et al. 2021)]MBF8377120.1 hypothetical protein [Alicyclobacillus mali (ex Roth et al. 2021)]